MVQQTNLCDNSDDKFGTAFGVIVLGVGDRCAFKVDFQNIDVN